jgi:hypothetical protein
MSPIRDHAGLIDAKWQERLTTLVHAPSADAGRVLDWDAALPLLDVDDHGDGKDRQDSEQDEACEIGAVQEARQGGGHAAHDAREDDEADAVADPLLGDELTQPHQDDGTRGQGDDLGDGLPAAEVERRCQDPVRVEKRQEAVGLQERHRHG